MKCWLFGFLAFVAVDVWGQYPTANGGSFTPQGPITYLILFHEPSTGPSFVPHQVNTPSNIQSLFYPKDSGFTLSAQDYTLSNRLYQNSRFSANPLRLSGYVHPITLRCRKDSIPIELSRYYHQNPKPPGFWQQFDRRKNKPSWTSFNIRNDSLEPDGKFDAVVLITTQPFGNSGVTPLGNFRGASIVPANLTIDGETGFICTGADNGHLEDVFVHELAHSLYKSPHHSGANSVLGPYWWGTPMYGMMRFGMLNSLVPAWERWVLGWQKLLPAHNLAPHTHPKATRVVLRDFITTGQVLRLQLPGTKQHIWWEFYGDSTCWPSNHPLWLKTSYTYDGLGNKIPHHPRGLQAYIVDMGEPSAPTGYGSNGMHINGVKWLQGTPTTTLTLDTLLFPDAAFWGNAVGRFLSGKPESTTGQTLLTGVRGNMWMFKTPNLITTSNYHGGGPAGPPPKQTANLNDAPVESMAVHHLNGRFTYSGLGTSAGFSGIGKKWGLSSNPMLQVPHQQYLGISERLDSIPLSGLSVQILAQGADSIVLLVRYDDVTVIQSTRWTGEMYTTRIDSPKGNILIANGARILLNASTTNTRRTRNTWDSTFTNPSLLHISQGTRFVIENGSLELQDHSGLHIEPGGELIVKGKGKLILGKGTTVILDVGAKLWVDPKGVVKADKSAYCSYPPKLKLNPACEKLKRHTQKGLSPTLKGYLAVPGRRSK